MASRMISRVVRPVVRAGRQFSSLEGTVLEGTTVKNGTLKNWQKARPRPCARLRTAPMRFVDYPHEPI